jgi:DDE superfamily endonuclease
MEAKQSFKHLVSILLPKYIYYNSQKPID